MSQRSNQVGEELRKIISKIFLEELTDPRIGFVTITRVEVAEDLRFAKVFYSVLGEETQKKLTAEAIADQLGYIRKLAVVRINMKFAMDFRFEPDPSIEESFRLGEILKKIHGDKKPEQGAEK